MSAAPLPAHEPQRLQALHRYRILDTAPEAGFDRITRLASELFEVPIALVSLVDEHRQWFKSCIGLEDLETSREISFCAHAILEPRVMVVPDATADPRFADNEAVTGDPYVRFYAGAPLTTTDGFMLGTLCVVDTEVRPDLTAGQRRLLATLADIVVSEIELRWAAHQLVDKTSELTAASVQAQEATAAKAKMMSTVSHELRNAVTAIQGFAELLVDGQLDGPEAEYASTIHSASSHLHRVVDDLLDLDTIERGQLRVAIEAVEVAEVAERVADIVRPLADQRGLELVVDAPSEMTVLADPARLFQVLLNLATNAVKYNRDGGRVSIEACRVGPTVHLVVADTGRGLSDAERQAVFEPFFRAASAVGEDGTGLGLAICVQLVEQMGGSIAVESHPDEGSRFTVSLRPA